MMSLRKTIWAALAVLLMTACEPAADTAENGGQDPETVSQQPSGTPSVKDFQFKAERFADLQVLRYRVPGFEELPAKKKELLYYLYEAAMAGREIIYDQNYKHNLFVKRSMENIYNTYSGERSGDNWEAFHTYLKRIWFSNGVHHHYSTVKFVAGFDRSYLEQLVANSDAAGFPLASGEDTEALVNRLDPILFDPSFEAKRVNKDDGVDMVVASANNLYEGVTQAEVDAYYDNLIDKGDKTPISYGLNSKLIKEHGKLMEKTYKVGGMYGEALEKVAEWLDKAASVAENAKQEKAFKLLADYFRTGDLKTFDEYSIAWVEATEGSIDVINGFIEVYGDPLGYRGAFESVVQMDDAEASQRMKVLSDNVQWFEDNSPIMDEHKKEKVTGVSYKVVTVVTESGDASPSTPIGINLPNANWIRASHGSKSVSLGNITEAYDEASGGGFTDEFAYSEEEKARSKEFGNLSSKLHTALHEVVGHASGKLEEGVGTPKQTIKNYASTLEEGRADLVALYFLLDPKMVELGLMPSLEVGKAEYDSYIRNGLMLQLRRLSLGDKIEEDHMRNRQLVALWAYEHGLEENVIEKKVENGKTYFVINDYEKLRVLFGELLREIQRIKSKGDFKEAKALVEGYGVKVDPEIHAEVLKRVEALDVPPYSGFINPVLTPVTDETGKITDVKITYPTDFTKQHLDYAKKYGILPTYN